MKAVLWGERKTCILRFAVASLLLKLGETSLRLHAGRRVLVGVGARAVVALHKACPDDLRIAQAWAVEDRTDGINGSLELLEVLTYVHRAKLSLILHLDIGIEGDEGLTVIKVRKHIGYSVRRGVVALRLDILEALSLVELEYEELLTLVHHQTP